MECWCTDFCEKKKEYEKAIQQLACLEIKEEKFIPVQLLKPLCSYKKRKGDRAIPTKRDELVEQYVSTKSRPDMNLEEWLRTKTTLFSRYKHENGIELTMEVIQQIIEKFNTKKELNFDDVKKVSI